MPFCDPIRQNLKRHNASDFIGDYLSASDQNWFLGIGKVSSWSSVTGSVSDNNPPAALDTDENETEFWRYLIATKRISQSDISLVIPRYDWTGGEVYTAYRNDIDLFDDVNPAKFYVLVDEERVYKCIDNAYGSPSTVPPSHTDAQIRQLSDGYRWKFLYQIPESKRKFLTRTYLTEGTNIGIISRQGYMPVEYVDFLELNDERTLQFSVQQAAVDGEIAFTEFNEEYYGFVTSDPTCLLPNTENSGISITGSGGTTGDTFVGYSPSLVGAEDNYVNRILSIDTGSLIGTRRVITAYTYNPSNSQGTFTVDPPFSSNQTLSGTQFSVLPMIVLEGDGSSGLNPPNPTLGYADINVKFGEVVPRGTSGCDLFTARKFVSSFEMVDTGKDYTFVNVTDVRGLTFLNTTGNINDIAIPVISPPGGHGSNPVSELGAAAVMIVKDFFGDEDGAVSVANEFRQFGIIKNPDLYKPIIEMFLERGGATANFTVGTTAYQGSTGMDGTTGFSLAQGTVIGWISGLTASGGYGTGEVRVTGITGTFTYGGIIESDMGITFGIVGKNTITKAGAEARRITTLEVVSADSEILSSTEFKVGQYAQGIGNFTEEVSPSRATGRVYSYSLQSGSATRANLLLEDVHGIFNEGEKVIACDYNLSPLYSLTSANAIKVSAIRSSIIGVPTVYKTTTKVTVNGGTAGGFFNATSFDEDEVINFASGSDSAYGTVVEWTATAGATNGILLLSGVNGTFTTGMTSAYNFNDNTYTATVTAITQEPDLKYRSGEVSYIQNIRPVQRDSDQREEVKIVINF